MTLPQSICLWEEYNSDFHFCLPLEGHVELNVKGEILKLL